VLVVDGNNVMGSRPDGWWKDRAGAARRLVEQIGAWATDEVLVYFDGAPHPGMPEPQHVEVRYANRRGRDAADDDIVAYVASHDTPSDLVVVTSDAELARRVRAVGAEVAGARWLLDRL
jgi:predicted RNA-binding protein with PIN domain